jgi:ABC-type transporter Mla maintaining outer membrane lipid asymmetry ATPase subunit MlaF
MIRLAEASLEGVFETASITMGQGEICAILADSDEAIRPLVKLFTGLEPPSSGGIWVLGEDVASLSTDALRTLRKRIGVAMNNGGLVSNLKAWENILLPLAYHGVFLSDEEANGKLAGLLERVGGEFDLTKRPRSLSIHARKLAGLMRAMLMEPDIIIYETLCDGLRGDAKNRLMATLLEFHQEKTGRLSVFIERDANMLNGITAGRAFTLEKGCLNARD